MPLAAGTRLGPYEIAAALGAGGMCEVYRATDTRLSRSVANKVLPEALLGAGGIGEVYRAAIRSSVETSRSRFWLRPFMVAKDRRVKVLDFGLAKLREDAVQIWTRRSARCARSPAAG